MYVSLHLYSSICNLSFLNRYEDIIILSTNILHRHLDFDNINHMELLGYTKYL